MTSDANLTKLLAHVAEAVYVHTTTSGKSLSMKQFISQSKFVVQLLIANIW